MNYSTNEFELKLLESLKQNEQMNCKKKINILCVLKIRNSKKGSFLKVHTSIIFVNIKTNLKLGICERVHEMEQ